MRYLHFILGFLTLLCITHSCIFTAEDRSGDTKEDTIVRDRILSQARLQNEYDRQELAIQEILRWQRPSDEFLSRAVTRDEILAYERVMRNNRRRDRSAQACMPRMSESTRKKFLSGKKNFFSAFWDCLRDNGPVD